jgi:7-carboxy-7-deazaguanine synthase
VCYWFGVLTAGYLSEVFVSFQGEGAEIGRRQLFVRLAGCNLRCQYCDTPNARKPTPSFRVQDPILGARELSNPVTPEDLLPHLVRMCAAEPPVDGMALTGGEPLLQAGFLAALLHSADLPRPRILETNGTLPEELALVLPWVDVVSMDLKLPSNSGEPPLWEVHAKFLRAAAGRAYIKILIDQNTRSDEIARAAALATAGDPTAPLFLQPITDKEGRIDATVGQLEAFFAIARRHARNVRIVPQVHKVLDLA